MASICPYPGRKCIGCQHRRIDEDLGAYACFVKQDLTAAAQQHGAKMPHLTIEETKAKPEIKETEKIKERW